MMRYVFSGALALLAMLHPVDPAHLLPICATAVLITAPGWFFALLFPRNRAIWANWLGSSDMLTVALPISAFCGWPELAVFAVCHQLTNRLIGGWILRCAGIRNEKNFTLILAYRQTIKHWHRFPQEIHPRENPLFQSARNAQNALLELLPLLGTLAGVWLNAMGFPHPNAPIAMLLTVALALPAVGCTILPHRKFLSPSFHGLLVALLRLFVLGLSVYLLKSLFPLANWPILLLCAMFPPLGPVEELRRSDVDEPLCRTLANASAWSILIFAISSAICLFL